MLLWRTFSDLTPVRLDVLRLQPGHHAAAVLLQAARLVELWPEALAHEAAVALQVRRIVDERRRQQRLAASPSTARELAGDAAQLLRQAHAGTFASQQLGAARRRGEPIAHRREIARRAAPEARGATQRAQCPAPPAAQRADRRAASPDR